MALSAPGKNLIVLSDMPPIAWTVTEGKKSKHILRLLISSEDQAILDVAKNYGV